MGTRPEKEKRPAGSVDMSTEARAERGALTRRQFLTGVAATGLGVALGGCDDEPQPAGDAGDTALVADTRRDVGADADLETRADTDSWVDTGSDAETGRDAHRDGEVDMDDAGGALAALTIETTSTSPTWQPSTLTNDGAPLRWLVDGVASTLPIDLSTSSGARVITAESADAFQGLTVLLLDDLGITSVDITEAKSLVDFSCKQNPGLTSIDVSTLEAVWRLTLRSNGLTDLDVSANPLLTSLFVYENQLATETLDQIVIDLDGHGLENGKLYITSNGGPLSEAAYASYQALLARGWEIDVASPPNPHVTPGATPVLSNFRVEGATPSQITFDAAGDISGLTTQGFVVSGKTITGVNTAQRYFTVATPFTYWDNNTMRLEGGDGTVIDFTLTYIENRIPEPSASTYRYVSPAATGSGNGQSEGSPWTVSQAVNNAAAGQTVWFKAGDYGNIKVVMSKNGTATNPIKFVGYKSVVGDITSNYWDYGVPWSAAEMPTFTGVSTADLDNTYAFAVASEYLIIRNMQFTKFFKCIRDTGATPAHCVFERLNLKDNHHATDRNASGIYLRGGRNHHIRILDSVAINSAMVSFEIRDGGGFNLIDGCKSYNDNPSEPKRTDYHFVLNKGDNIIRNVHCENFNNTYGNQSTHGITLKGYNSGSATAHNLIEKSSVINVLDGIMFRNYGVHHNVAKDCLVGNNGAPLDQTKGGLWFKGGVFDNVFERCTVENVDWAIGAVDNDGEDGTPPVYVGANNTVRNCTFLNCRALLYTASVSGGAGFDDNDFYNNTFVDIASLHHRGNSNVTITGLRVRNCIFDSVAALGGGASGWVFDSNDFWSSWSTGLGAAALNVDPSFVDLTTLVPQNTALKAGVVIAGGEYDKSTPPKEREVPPTLGAMEL